MTTYYDSTSHPTERLPVQWNNHFYDGSSTTTSHTEDDIVSLRSFPRTKNVISSGTTPGFHKMLEQGKLVPFTGYHVVGEEVGNFPAYSTEAVPFFPPDPSWIGGQGGWSEDVGSPCVTMQQVAASFPELTPVSFDPLLTRALGEAKAGALMFLLELAEAPKVVELFTKFNGNLERRWRFLRRTVQKRYNPRTLRDAARHLGNAWLEYRYGWRQLYYASEDLVSAVKLLRNEKHFVVNTGRGFASQTEDGTVTSSSLASTWGNESFLDLDATITLEQRAVVSLQVHKSLAALDVNPVALAWELVPFSFVVDWFVNTGDLARAIWPVPNIAQTAATSTKVVERINARYARDPIVQGHWSSSIGGYNYTREEYNRVPWEGDIPIVFDYNPRVGLSQILDILALARGGIDRHAHKLLRL